MVLYHYSKQLFNELKTSSALHRKPEELTKINKLIEKHTSKYSDHISLFLEPVPLNILGTIYKGVGHDIWYTGSKLYEYQVNIDNLPYFKYNLMETPFEIELLEDDRYEDLSLEEYIDLLYRKKKELHLVGDNVKEFKRQVALFTGLTQKKFTKLRDNPNWDKLKLLYAPTIPHVMLYPKGGIVNYEKVTEVEVKGNPYKVSAETIYSSW
jgi:hypothetical protein